MEPLQTYLRETRTTPTAFAKLIGVEPACLLRILSGEEAVSAALAQRMVDATGGALLLDDLVGHDRAGVVIDMRSRFVADTGEIDIDALSAVLAEEMPALIGAMRGNGAVHLPRLAAEAAAHTYDALATVTTRRGADRLAQALRPVFAEILEELGAKKAAFLRIDACAQQAASGYFPARKRKRRG